MDPSHETFANYGAKGVTIRPEWDDFATFFRDMGERPPGASLDRIDNTLGYCASNCRWANHKEQQNNKTNNRVLTHAGETMSMQQWSERLAIPVDRIRMRLKAGFSDSAALTSPVWKKRSRID